MKGLSIHPQKCTGCVQCELACSYVKTGTFRPARSLIRVHIFDELASYSPYTCFQCREAWCMTACPTNAIAINADTGAKVVLEQPCVGCGLCSIACPFGTVFYNPDTHKAYKCDLCSGQPACALACPTGAIEYAEIGDGDAPWLAGWSQNLQRQYQEVLSGAPSL